MTITVHRDAGHPWSGAPGWDLLQLEAACIDTLDVKISEAEGKRWRVWTRDQARAAALMYKPTGATATWEDDPRQGTPRAVCTALAVGDKVYTDFSSRITQHTVTDRATGRMTQTGVMLRVSPPVPGSGFLAEDPGARAKTFNNAWIDSAWFRPVY